MRKGYRNKQNQSVCEISLSLDIGNSCFLGHVCFVCAWCASKTCSKKKHIVAEFKSPSQIKEANSQIQTWKHPVAIKKTQKNCVFGDTGSNWEKSVVLLPAIVDSKQTMFLVNKGKKTIRTKKKRNLRMSLQHCVFPRKGKKCVSADSKLCALFAQLVRCLSCSALFQFQSTQTLTRIQQWC